MAAREVFPTNDPVKSTLLIPKIVLEAMGFWPERRNLLTKCAAWCLLTIVFVVESAQIAFVVRNITDLTEIATAMCTISPTFQLLTKLPALYFWNGRLKRMLQAICFDFWPLNVVPVREAAPLIRLSRLLTVCSLSVYVSGVLFGFGFLSAPLITGRRILPLASVFPFDWSVSPIYEIVYVIQWFANILMCTLPICGHDHLLMGICNNISAQYALLGEVLKHLGTGKSAKFAEKLNRFHGWDSQPSESDDEKLLKICIRHHQMLTEISTEAESIFTFSSFIQLISSISALCVGSLLLTLAEPSMSLFITTGAYVSGHVVQLFLICTMANEVTFKASLLPSYIFCSKWYQIEDNAVKKNIMFVIKRAQSKVAFTAFGIVPLDHPTFISALRLSFSFYTMLSKVAEGEGE